MKVGIIGLGKMGSIIAKALISKGYEVWGYDVRPERMEIEGLRRASNALEVVENCDVTVLAVKPKDVDKVLEGLGRAGLMISIAAGVPLSHLESKLPNARFVRAMPSILGEVGEAVTALSLGRNSLNEDLKLAEQVFGPLGETVVVEERLMDVVTGFAGGGPAYVFLFIEAMADAGVKAGLPREVALKIAAKTVLGSAKMVLNGGHPAKLKEMVATPGGVTIAGLYELEKAGLRATMMDAVAAAVKRAKEISEELEKA